MLQLSVTEFDVCAAIRDFLITILPSGTDVVKTQQNRVPEPLSENFVLMTPLNRARLSMNVDSYDPDSNTRTIEQSTQYSMQLDIHGPASADNAQLISTLFRDAYGVTEFGKNAFTIAPLYTSDPNQMPFINAENQYEFRWVVRTELQIKPNVTVDQKFAKDIKVGIINVDATYSA